MLPPQGPLFVMWVLQLPLPVAVFALASERAGGQAGLLARQVLLWGWEWRAHAGAGRPRVAVSS